MISISEFACLIDCDEPGSCNHEWVDSLLQTHCGSYSASTKEISFHLSPDYTIARIQLE